MRAQAAQALGRTGRLDFVPYLQSHLDDEWEVAAQGARALARLGDQGRAALQAREDSGAGGHAPRTGEALPVGAAPGMREMIVSGLQGFDLFVLGYFLSLDSLYLGFSVVAFFRLMSHRRRGCQRALDTVLRSPATPPISLIVPAYGEEATIADSLRGLLLCDYPHFEVVVINDGSKDRTLDVAIQAFGLMRAPVAFRSPSTPRRCAGCIDR